MLFIPFPQIGGKEELPEYLSLKNTLPIKGFSVVLVFFSHFKQYVVWGNSVFDQSYLWINGKTGQLIVTMFLFYSGYGIYESIRKKGEQYGKGFLRNRFLVVWLNFAICLCFFLVYDLVVGANYGLYETILSFTGWESIGNSNWFMFVTFSLYLLVFASFFGFAKTNQYYEKTPLVIFSITVMTLAVVLYFVRPAYWYNTVFCFPSGMWYSFYKDKIDNVMKCHYWLILLTLFVANAAVAFVTIHVSIAYSLLSVVFSLLVVAITVKLRFRSPILAFLGKHVFSIYILQRLVFMILQKSISNTYIYFVVSFLTTVGIAALYDYVFSVVRRKIKN